ncbi:ATPase subunit of ABC transporter with duplicated ATPase domains [Sinobacterium caligoides]|uniref:ATPase subunit of ABC transporter with duplicated ATPase domains n=1 Tax=Sinobacterium caligoides TaxID=933926 RepID=A0A3N2DXN5_9GAMM|nr:ATP-binding cassette domain-containing protein [Sinobacterium caligoides]ROS04620.1 ATPase subunit of ABC transporter with duplicated ATPase domains [Sinobacterium caligoides]
MPLLQAQQISYQFDSGEMLFSNISCKLSARRTGLIGRNGCGKSVLASILAKQRKPSDGNVILNGSVESFSQLTSTTDLSHLTLLQYLQLDSILGALRQVERGHYDDNCLEIIGDKWRLENELKLLFAELGLNDGFNKKCDELSGGQLTRLKLWKLLHSGVDLLVLDEPSNHLDHEGRQWLAREMAQFNGHILLISHDRMLLRQVSQIWHLSGLGLRQYGGNFDTFFEQQQLEKLAIERQLDNVQRHQKKLKKESQSNREKADIRAKKGLQDRRQGSQPKIAMNTMRSMATASAANRAKNDHGRRERLEAKYQSLQARQEKLKQQAFTITTTHSKITTLVSFTDCVLAHGMQQPISFVVKTGSKVHVSGRNGSGKSTLLKTLLGRLPVASGEASVNAPLYYLDQHFSLLNKELSLLETLSLHCPTVEEHHARTMLAGIGFRHESVHRLVKQLSGGEKMKLAMLVASRQAANPLLLLDEPDNHLDLDSKTLLARALKEFNGSFLLVSHDQDFISECDINYTIDIKLP